MHRTSRQVAIVAAALSLAVACAKVPYTGRSQLNVVPERVMNDLGRKTYAEVLSESDVERRGRDATVLAQVGHRIAEVADAPGYAWEFSMIRSDEVNAWCLPGGYIGFYKGILPALRNEAGMAFVMGHEVAHATAHHGAERLSQHLAVMGGLTAIDGYLSGRRDLSVKQRQLLVGALGAGATVGILLPFSRTHESEADVIGMMYMSKAGYPPAESIEVWQRMESTPSGPEPPAFLSTHPASDQRQAELREWLPEARKRYERNALPEDTRAPLWTGTDRPRVQREPGGVRRR
jgi:predicted Zn-dependent protease